MRIISIFSSKSLTNPMNVSCETFPSILNYISLRTLLISLISSSLSRRSCFFTDLPLFNGSSTNVSKIFSPGRRNTSLRVSSNCLLPMFCIVFLLNSSCLEIYYLRISALCTQEYKSFFKSSPFKFVGLNPYNCNGLFRILFVFSFDFY